MRDFVKIHEEAVRALEESRPFKSPSSEKEPTRGNVTIGDIHINVPNVSRLDASAAREFTEFFKAELLRDLGSMGVKI
jgi:hypothetical protein